MFDRGSCRGIQYFLFGTLGIGEDQWKERYVKARRTIESELADEGETIYFHFSFPFIIFWTQCFSLRAVKEIFLSGIDVFEFSNLLQFVSVSSPGIKGRGARC